MEILTTDKKENEKFLHKETEEVDIDSLSKEEKKEWRETIKEMRKTMNEADGVGLSANQVGIPKRVFVAQITSESGEPQFYSMINPHIIDRSEKEETMMEGCLSITDKQGTVRRPLSVKIKYSTLEGRTKKMQASGLLARVFQHEVDHLNGVLFTDKAEKVFDKEEIEKMKKENN